ncbi:MAG TPA: hypothetical protein VHI13_01670 [Candidatus Kapabacteria bacterium]|nr:hypothetical protein [Candidatus Kapabacteria bacterium]
MSDSTPSFVQVLSSKLFVMPRNAGDVGWCAYLLGRNDVPPPPPDNTITIAQSFNTYNGHYLFALTAPTFADETQVDQFITAVRTYLDGCFGVFGQPFNGQACAWIPNVSNPASPVFGRCGGYAFSFAADLGGPVLQSNFNNPLGNQLTLSAGIGTPLTYNATGLVVNASGGVTGVSLITSPDSGKAPSITANQATIPFVGQYSGCFLLGGTIKTAVTLAYFNAGVRYSFSNSGSTLSQNYPVVVTSTPGTTLNYIGAIDPLDPVNGSSSGTVNVNAGLLRTLLAPTVTGSSMPELASWLRTRDNRSIGLVPLGSGDVTSGPAPFSGAFIFEYAGAQPTTPTVAPLYMTYAGDFGLAVAGTSSGSTSGDAATCNLLCGLFGSETMTFRPYVANGAYDPLRFVPRNAAYAPVFPFASATLNDPTSGAVGERLKKDYLTSWCMIVGGKATYDAQPEASPLYVPDCSGKPPDVPVLGVYPVETILLDKPGFAVPLAVYAGVPTAQQVFSQDQLTTYESQIVSPTRKSLIAKSVEQLISADKLARRARLLAGTAVAADAPTQTTTPQGLLAQVAKGSVGSDYVKVTLAQSEPAPDRPPEMVFWNLETPLQNLFQTNQLFSVVVNPKNLGELISEQPVNDPTGPAFYNTVTITDWTMAANVGNGVMATDYRNVMIMKFGDGTVQQRVANPNKWIATDQFSVMENVGDISVALTGLSQWLQNFIAAAIAEATVKNNHLYKNFARVVTDPNWNGILVVRADVPNLPDQIRGLAAGIDFTRFEAHHFGVTVSRVEVDGCNIKISGPSSMFGLIDYQLPLYQQNVASGGNPDVPLGLGVSGPYNFTVLQLQALFINSTMVDFQSRVQLTTNTLYDTRVIETYSIFGRSAANAVVLKGSYQTQGKTSTYVFEQNTPTVFIVDSNLFNAIAFSRVQFNTLTTGSGATATIASRFLIWGVFDFAKLEDAANNPFDMLSFGSPADTPPGQRGKGLAYSNLQILLSSPADAPNAVTYTFDSGGIGFDLANSKARDGSLFPTFALQLDSFIAAPAGKRPADYGYLPVRVGVPITELSGPWYGVVYKITMGTPGALVSGAGFESRMLMAWSPQTLASGDTYSAFAGLQLPGAAPGAKLMSLQGVLKVSIDSIVLTYDPVVGSEKKAFNLKLNNMGLKFLGIVKLPPGATINFFLFGDPNSTGSLGWYAAYNKNPKSAQPLLVPVPDVHPEELPAYEVVAIEVESLAESIAEGAAPKLVRRQRDSYPPGGRERG